MAFYGANGTAAETDDFPTTVEWHLYYSYTINADDGQVITVKAHPDPVHLGGITTRAVSTDHTFGDYFGIAIADSTGRVAIAYCDDYPAISQNTGTSAWQCPIRVIQQVSGTRSITSNSFNQRIESCSQVLAVCEMRALEQATRGPIADRGDQQ